MANKCNECGKPGTRERKVVNGYHVECRPEEGADGADGQDGVDDEKRTRLHVAKRVKHLVPLIEDGTISPADFARIISDMPGCRDAFKQPGEDAE